MYVYVLLILTLTLNSALVLILFIVLLIIRDKIRTLDCIFFLIGSAYFVAGKMFRGSLTYILTI
jgi:hypothetical protein